MEMKIRFAVARWLRELAGWVAAPAVAAKWKMMAGAVAEAVEPIWPDFLVARETSPDEHIEHLSLYLFGLPKSEEIPNRGPLSVRRRVRAAVRDALDGLEDHGSISTCALHVNDRPDGDWCDEILIRRGKAEAGS